MPCASGSLWQSLYRISKYSSRSHKWPVCRHVAGSGRGGGCTCVGWCRAWRGPASLFEALRSSSRVGNRGRPGAQLVLAHVLARVFGSSCSSWSGGEMGLDCDMIEFDDYPSQDGIRSAWYGCMGHGEAPPSGDSVRTAQIEFSPDRMRLLQLPWDLNRRERGCLVDI